MENTIFQFSVFSKVNCRSIVDNLFCLNDLQLYESMAESTKIPLLVINNTEDGEQAIEKTIKSILTFVKKQSHLRVEM